jgi:hypothetical protein
MAKYGPENQPFLAAVRKEPHTLAKMEYRSNELYKVR